MFSLPSFLLRSQRLQYFSSVLMGADQSKRCHEGFMFLSTKYKIFAHH